MNFQTLIAENLSRQLIRTPRGRAWMLNQIADAEDNGEAAVFDEAIAIVDDPRFEKMIARHKEDEIRHGRLFRDCLGRQGIEIGPVPSDVKVLEHLNRLMDGFFERGLQSTEDVVTAFLALQAIEERAVAQFDFYRPIFEEFDPETAEVLRQVAKDEARHLKYCKAITRHYQPDDAKRDAELRRLRRIEATAFRMTEQANLRHIKDRRIIENAVVRLLLSAAAMANRRTQPKMAVELLAA